MIQPIVNTTQLACEQSGTPIASIEEAHSMVAVLQKVDLINGYTFYQCQNSPQYVNFVNYQHWHVDKNNLQKGMADCLTNHYSEGLLHPIPVGQGQTNLAAIVLGAGLICKMSGVPLVSTAYRFCLTQCTPVAMVPDQSQDMLGEWCSTLDLALKSALATIANL